MQRTPRQHQRVRQHTSIHAIATRSVIAWALRHAAWTCHRSHTRAGHLDAAALRNLARGMSSARVTVWKVDSGLKAGCGMTSDWNTCWSYAQDGTCVGCEDSIYFNETRKWRECTLTTRDESSAKQPGVDDPTSPDPGRAQSSPAVATPSASSANRLVKASSFGRLGATLVLAPTLSSLVTSVRGSMSSIEARPGCRILVLWRETRMSLGFSGAHCWKWTTTCGPSGQSETHCQRLRAGSSDGSPLQRD